VMGIYCERLLAAELGIENLAGLIVAKSDLVKRGGVCDASVRNCLGFSGGCPTFATVHRHIST
jgi:hypothetical protein